VIVVDVLRSIDISGDSYSDYYRDQIQKFGSEIDYEFETHFSKMLDDMESGHMAVTLS
jgi:hypothetical protein